MITKYIDDLIVTDWMTAVHEELKLQTCSRCTYHFMLCQCPLVGNGDWHGIDFDIYKSKWGNYIPCSYCYRESQQYIDWLYNNPGRIRRYHRLCLYYYTFSVEYDTR
jgi:hypothetical protein